MQVAQYKLFDESDYESAANRRWIADQADRARRLADRITQQNSLEYIRRGECALEP